MSYINGSMEKITDQRSGMGVMYDFLIALKSELGKVFGEDEDLDGYGCWCNIQGTVGWETALEEASRTTFPEIAKLKRLLNWRDDDGFDAWIVDCALWYELIQKPTEDESDDEEEGI